MDDWAWEHLQPWLTVHVDLPAGPLLCIGTRPTRGRAWAPGAARTELRQAAVRAGVDDVSRRIGCATRTLSRWPARACR